jgi:putative molybdopterin biosynthesis protein
MKTLAEAKEILRARFADGPFPGKTLVGAPDAVGRVLAEPVAAKISSPNYHAAAMDGFAVLAADTLGASESTPVRLALGTRAHPVNTGHRLPPGTDAVIMVEDVHETGGEIQIHKAAYPWQHVRKVGEDIVATELLFPRNRKMDPAGMAALLMAGVFSVAVKKRPRVLIIPTGNELVPWREAEPLDLPPGAVLETNSEMLGKLVEEAGGVWIRHPIVPDDHAQLREAVARSLDSDIQMTLILAGSSAGSEDHTANVVEELGTVLVHGVAVMPGKPVVLGEAGGKPVIGIPGYPVSAIVAFEEFVRPLLGQMLGQFPPSPDRPSALVEPARKVASRLGIEELVRVKLGRVGGRIVAAPLPRAAGSITTFTEADGILRIPADSEGLLPGAPVSAELLTPLSAIGNTLVAVGSHDNTLDILADALKARDYRMTLSSSHAGSTGGLMAVKRGACHVAGTHLLDTADGSYNVSHIRRLLPEVPVKLVHLVMREQGFILKKGNPKGIRGVEDLARRDVVFVNRQGGSGTRILLDYKLGLAGVDPAGIQGYGNEEVTHMGVAVAVMSGAADCGLGIKAAADALGLDFVPVAVEQYDLLIPERFFDTEPVRVLRETIRTPEFLARTQALGGYHTERTGEVIL